MIFNSTFLLLRPICICSFILGISGISSALDDLDELELLLGICIPPAPSMLESFSSSAAKVMNHLNQMDLAKTSSNVTAVVESSAKIFSDASVILETSRPSVTAILSNLESATAPLKEFAEKINREPSLLLRSSDQPPLPETSR